MSWKPVGDRVIVRKIYVDNKTDSGIFLSETLANELDKSATAEVVAVGTNIDENVAVNVGDIIIYHKHYGTDISGMVPTDHDKDLMVLSSEDILGVVSG